MTIDIDLERELLRVTGGTVQIMDETLHIAAEDWYEPVAVLTDPRKLLASLRTMPDYCGSSDPDGDALVRFLVGMMNGVVTRAW